MTSNGGILRGNSLDIIGQYDGQLLEYIKDNLTPPVLYYWSNALQEWKIFSGSSSGSITYQNSNVMSTTVGGFTIGTNFSTPKTIQEMFDGLLYPYVAPSIGFSTTSPLIQELGTSLSSIQLNANITKKSDNITKIEYYKGSSLIYTNSSPNSNGGTDNYTDASGINSSTTYSVKVYDSKPNTVSSSISFNYIYPMYIGNVDNSNPTESDIKGMTKKLVVKGNQSLSYTVSNSRFCFAFPSLYGNLISIKDPNNFEMISTFTKTTSNFTMLDGLSVSYNIYTLTMPTTQNNFIITYIF
jgi:hypothetical protein